MAAKWTSKLAALTVLDGGALSMVVGPGEGNFQVDSIQEDNSEAIATFDRGVFDGFVEGDDGQQSFSIAVKLKVETLTHGTVDRIMDAFRKTGAWASGTTKDPAGVKWAVQLEFDLDNGSGTTAKLTLPCARATLSVAETKEEVTLNISGTNYQAPTLA